MAYLCGRWKWNAIVWCSTSIKNNKDYPINFTNGGVDRKRLGFRIDLNGSNHTIGYIKDKTTSYKALFHDHSSLLEAAYFTLNGNFPNEMDFGKVPQKIDDEFYEFFVANATNCDTIADKLQYIAENEQRVYDKGYQVGNDAGYDEGLEAGYGNGYSEGESKGYEVGKTEGYNQGKGDGLIEGYNNGYQDGLASTEAYEKGKQAEYDAFWEAFQDSGTRTYYGDAFRGATFEYIRPKYQLKPTEKTGACRTFYACKNLKKAEAAYIDFSQIPRGSHISETYYNTFTMCYELEEIEDIGFVPTFGYGSTFNVCRSLKKIAVIRADAGTQFLNDTFGNCTALEEITFEGEIGSDINFQWSTKLNRASIENIINHLSDTASGKTLTLSNTATKNAFPAWDDWGALVMAHQNWEITLV